MEDFAQAVAACEMDGYIARSSKEKLFDDDKYKELFKSDEPFFYLARYWLMRYVKGRLQAKAERRDVRWLVGSFLWSRLSAQLKGVGQLRAFSERCQRSEPPCVESLERAIDTAARAALGFYRATQGKGADEVDMPTIFKSKRSSLKEFVVYLKSSASVLAAVDKQFARVSQAIA
jgi:hypothetical protein